VGIGTGILLQFVTPWSLPWPAWIRHGCGWPLILAGLWLGAWAVRAAAGVDLERPNQLVDSGPYAYGYVGAAMVAGTAWPLLLLPVVLVVTHVVVLREERSLERCFGAAYRNYKMSVRRYL
jgi:protein-S-isoprenylcysteine O-methyltransferase Ste14